MKLHVHYCPKGFCNCYILGMESDARNAIIIDPGEMDEAILGCIEDSNYTLKAILLTHSHKNHVRGISALMRIYSTDVYAMLPKILDARTILVRDGDTFNAGGFNIEVISVPGHSADSVVYRTGKFLFTGDAISAGLLGNAPSPYGAMRQIAKIQNTIFTLPGDCFVFPGHGPPSSLNIERKYNTSIERFQENRSKMERIWYNLELLE